MSGRHMVAAVLGLFSVFESFGMLLIGVEALRDPAAQAMFGVMTRDQLKTAMFLQLVAAGHILLFTTRGEHWSLEPPYAAPSLFLYNIAWMVALGGVRVTTEHFVDFRTARHRKSIAMMNEPLHPAAASTAA